MVNASRNFTNAPRNYAEQILALANHRAERRRSPALRADMVSAPDTGSKTPGEDERMQKKAAVSGG
jgi:hypothetical protein